MGDDWNVFCPANPGCAEADTSAACTIERAAENAINLIKRQWLLIGFSIGARIACEIALRRPDLVSGLVLIDGSVSPGDANQLAQDMAEKRRRLGHEAVMAGAVKEAVMDGLSSTELSRVITYSQGTPEAVAWSYEISMMQWDIDRFVPTVAAVFHPALIIQSTTVKAGANGRWDRQHIGKTPRSEWLAVWKGAGGQIRSLKACCHWAALEQPVKMARWIEAFAEEGTVPAAQFNAEGDAS